MPQVTVYVRLEDMDRWKAITKKSDFIHKALRGVQSSGVTLEREELGSSPIPKLKEVKPSSLPDH